jgi:glycosyltransferase involved in cell wall biosynthesis
MSDYEYDFSFVVPIYNEIKNIDPLSKRIVEVMSSANYSYEIIYVDDGSQDGSSQKIEERAAQISELKPLHFKKNNGQSAAFLAGFRAAEGRYIVTLDADLQVDPEDLFKLIPYLDEYDMVVGKRERRNDSFKKRISSKIANKARNFITDEKISDTGCPLKVFKNEIKNCFYPLKGMHRFYPTLAKLNEYSVKEVPINHYQRQFGSSKYGINNRLWSGLIDTLVIRWIKKRHINYYFKED